MPKPIKDGRYMAGLDGLRALAVLAVIAYHLNLSWAPGGLLGVGVFFVLSGYLITDLLIAQWRRNARIDLKDFWLRRARRLLPALFVMLVAVTAYIALSDRSQLASLKEDVLAAVFYVSNWWYIFHHVSYFARFGPPSPLRHLWSLAVEEQFYVLWPLMLALMLRFLPKKWQWVGITLALASASAVAMGVMYQPGTDPSRVYYGTDTRAFALLIGAALAVVWPSQSLNPVLSRKARVSLDLIGGVGLLLVMLMIWKTNQYEVFLYRGGLVVLSVASAILVAALAHPASRMNRLLGFKPLRWLGVRSYGIYLWHYPVIVLTNPPVNTTGIDVPRAILQVAASIVLAAVSWHFVENPIRHGGLQRLWKPVRQHKSLRRVHRQRLLLGLGTAFGSVALTAVVYGVGQSTPAAVSSRAVSPGTVSGMMSARTIADVTQESFMAESSTGKGSTGQNSTGMLRAHGVTPPPAASAAVPVAGPIDPGTDQSQTDLQSGVVLIGPPQPTGGQPSSTSQLERTAQANQGQTISPKANPIRAAAQSSAAATRPTPAASIQAQRSGIGVTAIGDSVMVDAAPYLKQLLPGIVVDGQVGRQLIQTPSVISQLKAQGELGSRVIIELGTNGPFTKEQLVSLLQSLGPVKQIVLVNTRVPRPWQDVVNATISQVAATFPHATLVNWYAASAGKNSIFYPDGVHLNPQGAQFYASLLANAVEP
ncbi:acetyltransferase [Alicyclobacillus tolerans]|uniref:acyltransferase family protein n=1 Tax=Alicyclobacillus tolerans TaxID=90970 RepID=UPI001F22862A|nr:acyltransferase family protein [Alicyclobacillus tolerans]MCF8566571.1 acetyltransferase [Alicyclobacillus tolerans]